jgi:Fe-S-cluster-containing dehydrogenase component
MARTRFMCQEMSVTGRNSPMATGRWSVLPPAKSGFRCAAWTRSTVRRFGPGTPSASAPAPGKLGLVIDLDTCVGCHACVVACKGWNTELRRAAVRCRRLWRGPVRHLPQPRPQLRGDSPRTGAGAARAFPKVLPALRRRALRHRLPHRRQLQARRGRHRAGQRSDCIGCGLCAWACPYGAREMDAAAGVMKKCTLCVDRIYNENLPEEDRVPACVRTCPAGARHFGDLPIPTAPCRSWWPSAAAWT